MARGQDLRPQSTKATISWSPAWMGFRDQQGDRVGDWAVQVDYKTFRCRWCKKVGSESILKPCTLRKTMWRSLW